MIPTNDMRPGMTLDLDGELWSVLEYQHHKPGKGAHRHSSNLRAALGPPLRETHQWPSISG